MHRWMERRKNIFYLTMHTIHFINGYMMLDIANNHSDSERKPAAATWATLSD